MKAKRKLPAVHVVDSVPTTYGRLEIYRERNGKGDFRARIVRNGRVLWASTEGYRRRGDLVASMNRALDTLNDSWSIWGPKR
jgi:uncharacterized protein YegP (UPF0339 family)